jgi:hypothetical protein
MAFDIADPPVFTAIIPLVRLATDGTREQLDVTVRIPSTDADTAESAAVQIGYAIVENLPDVGDNNRYGWKLAQSGPIVAVAR